GQLMLKTWPDPRGASPAASLSSRHVQVGEEYIRARTLAAARDEAEAAARIASRKRDARQALPVGAERERPAYHLDAQRVLAVRGDGAARLPTVRKRARAAILLRQHVERAITSDDEEQFVLRVEPPDRQSHHRVRSATVPSQPYLIDGVRRRHRPRVRRDLHH